MTPKEALEKCRAAGATIKNSRDKDGKPRRCADDGQFLYDAWFQGEQISQEARMQEVTWEVAKRASRNVEFGQAVSAQLAHRRFTLTERGEIDPASGELKATANAGHGVRFISSVEQMVASGFLEQRHEDAADFFAGVWREVLGSPSAKDVCDVSIGVGEGPDHSNSYAKNAYHEVRARLSVLQRAELERTLWESDFGYTTRPELFRAGLSVVADYQEGTK